MKLESARILVTGGSSGIGRATAAALIAKGARVAINGRNPERLAAAGAELGCLTLAGDVSREEDARAIVARFVEEFSGIDGLINNAGFGTFAPLVDTRLEDVRSVFETNVFGAFLMAREVAKHLIEQRSGTIVNIASTASLKGFAGGTAYAASKFALRGMNDCWRDELRRHDVKVLLINPSEVITDFFRRAGGEQKFSDRKLQPEDIATAIVDGLEMGDRAFIPELAVFATNPF
jgi:3-oxoacyl-[acyl-carrier protein] reductase